jgi:hypothetical protein
VFVVPPTETHDFNGDCQSDIVWRDSSGQLALWFMNGAAIASATSAGTVTTDWSVVGQRDFNADGYADILWRNTSGQAAMWFMNGAAIQSAGGVGSEGNVPTNWTIVATGDFNGDHMSDILWRDTSGNTAVWLMNGTTILPDSAGFGNVPGVWTIQGTNVD